ncbi:hypothetical protein ELQ12_05005 [Campylobacter sp. US25a]|uniref:Uncharacterized protein n=1 Tax=Campylobacter jejuni TaxID=197 RepID=A0AB36G2N9_CAMJU|nr:MULTISPECIES: hypothetical protein [Campylobacter]ECL3537310.1 hypothetical protein [Campylobacter jejuni]ECP5951997.1 hypothetical protein [Campylobacter jejuni]ECP9363448.1 hypothetical protein [Campylobacter jejuni]ECR1497614.1 hypothetical protein [Campylobacter jejuni]MCW1350876.1 hypothetical protein [Campylobacter jejuni]
MLENLKEIYEEFELLIAQFSSYFNDEEFLNFKKDFDVKNVLNYHDFKEFTLEETDKERLKDIQDCLLAYINFCSSKDIEKQMTEVISKIFMPMFLISRLYFILKEEKLDMQIRKILKEKDKLTKEKSLWVSKILPF